MATVIALAIALASSGLASAQPAPDAGTATTPPSAPSVADPPTAPTGGADVVVLRNGGLVRGSIVELVPGDHVVVRSLVGTVRTFAMSEVEYAGPERNRPPSTGTRADVPGGSTDDERSSDDRQSDGGAGRGETTVRPEIVVTTRRVRLSLRARDGEDLTFYLVDAAGEAELGDVTSRVTGIRRLCTAPCAVTLAAGRYRLALARHSDRPRELRRTLRLLGGARLTGYFDDRSTQRRVGGIVAAAAIATGVGVFIALVESGDR